MCKQTGWLYQLITVVLSIILAWAHFRTNVQNRTEGFDRSLDFQLSLWSRTLRIQQTASKNTLNFQVLVRLRCKSKARKKNHPVENAPIWTEDLHYSRFYDFILLTIPRNPCIVFYDNIVLVMEYPFSRNHKKTLIDFPQVYYVKETRLNRTQNIGVNIQVN